MTTSHYVVAEQDRAWHFSFKGDLTGPYGSRDDAVAAAISEAKKSPQSVEVVVRDADMKTEIVWRPGTP